MDSILPWQQQIWQGLQRRIEQQRMPHALLLHGPKGTGKKSLSLALAKSLLCEQRTKSGEGCGHCNSCRLFVAHTHTDLHLLEPEEGKSVLAVDQVRGMVEKFSYTPQIANRKVAIINPAETMNSSAANSLLKTLEEPSGEAVLMLISHAPASLLPTIRSRCQQLAFPQPSRTEALAWLGGQLDDKSMADTILGMAEGAPLRALALSGEGQQAHYQQMAEELVELLQGRANPIRVAYRWNSKKLDPTTTLRWLQQWVTTIIKQQFSNDPATTEPVSSLFRLLQRVDRKRFFLFSDRLNQAIRLSTTPVNKELLFEGLLLEWIRLAGDPLDASSFR